MKFGIVFTQILRHPSPLKLRPNGTIQTYYYYYYYYYYGVRFLDLMSHLQDGGHDVISRRKVLPCGECIRCICPAHGSITSTSLWSIIYLYRFVCRDV